MRLFVVVSALFVALASTAADAQPASSRSATVEVAHPFDDAVTAAKLAMTSNPVEAFDQARVAELNSDGVLNGKAIALWLQSEAVTRQNRPEEALPLIAAARRYMTSEDPKLTGDLLLSEARALGWLQKEGLALSSYQDAYRVFEEIGDTRLQAISLEGIGVLYQRARRWDRALEYFKRTIEVHPTDKGMRYAAQHNIARIMLERDLYGEAIKAFEPNVSIAEETGHAKKIATVNGMLAEAHTKAGSLDLAERYLSAAKEYDDHEAADLWSDYLTYVEALISDAKGDYDAADRHYTALFDGYDFSRLTDTYRSTHEAAFEHYTAVGDYEQALRHHVAFKTIDDRRADDAARNNFALLNTEFEFERLEKEKLEAEILATAQRARLRNLLVTTAFVGAAVILGLLLIHIRSSWRARDELARTNEKLIEASEAKSQFLANTSHEIRNPLNAIIGFCEVMVAKGQVSGQVLENVQTIWSSGNDLLAIVNDILDVSKMEGGKMAVELAPVDVGKSIEQVVAQQRVHADRKGLEIVLNVQDDLPRYVTDDFRIRQVMINLVGNAIKFTKNGSVTIAAGALPRGGFEVCVSDTGIGIPANQIEKVFESFGQVDGQSRATFGGTGLGLALVRNIATLLGGEISVDSKVGQGSSFTLRIPAEEAEPSDETETVSLPERASPPLRDVPRMADGKVDLKSLRILLAEDVAPNVLVIKGMIGDAVASIDVAPDGAVAVQMVQQSAYDLILMDNQMPNMTGLEATKIIRTMPGVGAIPIIGCTGDATANAKAELMEAGMNSVVDKPVTIKTLVAALTRAFGDDAQPASDRRAG